MSLWFLQGLVLIFMVSDDLCVGMHSDCVSSLSILMVSDGLCVDVHCDSGVSLSVYTYFGGLCSLECVGILWPSWCYLVMGF